jgi:hypothetical protein
MSRIVIGILIYHRHKPVKPKIPKIGFNTKRYILRNPGIEHKIDH